MPVRLPRLRIPRLGLRLTRRRLITAGVVLIVLLAVVGWAAWPTPPPYSTTEQMLTVRSGPDGTEPVALDSTLYLPREAGPDHPVPAILLAHGFGGTKRSVATDAEEFAGRGYAVLTWSDR